MIRMAGEEEQEGKNPPSVLLVEAISADDKDDDDSSLMRMMITTNVCAYISYSYAKVIDFAARAVQTWEPLDDAASMAWRAAFDCSMPQKFLSIIGPGFVELSWGAHTRPGRLSDD